VELVPGIRQRKKLTVFEGRMLRRIFKRKRDEVGRAIAQAVSRRLPTAAARV
jgi:hypothetical protein